MDLANEHVQDLWEELRSLAQDVVFRKEGEWRGEPGLHLISPFLGDTGEETQPQTLRGSLGAASSPLPQSQRNRARAALQRCASRLRWVTCC